MRRLALAPLLTATLLVAGFAPAAEAETAPLPLPSACRFQSVGSALFGPDAYRGVIYSEPVAAAALPPSDPLANPVSITVICTLHVSGPTPDPAIEVSGSGTVVAAVAPTTVAYTATAEDHVYLCTSARLTDANGATSTYYQSDDNGMWRSTPDCDGLKCLALGANCDYTLALIEWLVDHGAPPLTVLDDTICSILASLSPGVTGVVDIDPTGDTYVLGVFVWDCPPYVA